MKTEYRNTKAIVIRKTKFKESSAILQCFTKDFSLVSVLAKGIFRSKNNFYSHLETLSINKIEYFYKPTRNVHTLIKSELLYYPDNIIKDYKTFLIIKKIFKLIEMNRYHTESTDKIYDLIENTIFQMNNNEHPKQMLIKFYIKYLIIEGLFNKEYESEIKTLVIKVFEESSKKEENILIKILENRINAHYKEIL